MKRNLSLVIFSNHFALQFLFSGYKALKNLIFLSVSTLHERAVLQVAGWFGILFCDSKEKQMLNLKACFLKLEKTDV